MGLYSSSDSRGFFAGVGSRSTILTSRIRIQDYSYILSTGKLTKIQNTDSHPTLDTGGGFALFLEQYLAGPANCTPAVVCARVARVCVERACARISTTLAARAVDRVWFSLSFPSPLL